MRRPDGDGTLERREVADPKRIAIVIDGYEHLRVRGNERGVRFGVVPVHFSEGISIENKATWAQIVALYRLTMHEPPHNLRPRSNVCPTGPVGVVTQERELVTMRWGLVPWWWSKPLKELRMATFNARETVETKPVFRDAFKRSRCLIPMSGYYEWQNTPSGKQPWYFTARDGSSLLTAAVFGMNGKIACTTVLYMFY
jgi:putative SOS response-associated peptidase YedK